MNRAFLSTTLWALTLSPAFAVQEQDKIFVGVVFAALLLSGLVLFFRGFAALRRKRLIEDTPTSTIRAMAPGHVEVAGLPVEWRLMEAPFSRKPCVYYEVAVEEQRERRVTDKDGKTRTERYWVTLHSADTSEIPFYLDDGTGKLLVRPGSAEIILKDHYLVHSASPLMRQYLSQNGVSPAWGRPLMFTERSFRPGHPLYALGVCQPSTAPKDPPEGSVVDYCLAKGKEGEAFILSDKGQKSLTSSLGWKAFFGIFFGILLLAAAVYFWTVYGRVFERGY